MASEIYRDGRHYDRMFPDAGPAISFLLDQARALGGPVLELACGTGRLALPLAQVGFAVTGLDMAETMLAEARRRSADIGVAVDWVQGDMRAFDLGTTFSLVILAANSLGHLLDRASLEGCLAAVRRHLAPNGRFVIDVFVPDLRLLTQAPDRRSPFAEYDDPDGAGRVVVTSTNRYEPDTQINRITTYHRLPGRDDEIVGALDLRMYFPQELDALLAYNGLPVEAKYADYDRRPFGSEATKQLITCRSA